MAKPGADDHEAENMSATIVTDLVRKKARRWMLTAVADAGPSGVKLQGRMLKVRCDCGKTCTMPSTLFNTGRRKSCGCLAQLGRPHGAKTKSLVGLQFASLLVTAHIRDRLFLSCSKCGTKFSRNKSFIYENRKPCPECAGTHGAGAPVRHRYELFGERVSRRDIARLCAVPRQTVDRCARSEDKGRDLIVRCKRRKKSATP